jgi:hypothetical protein
LSHAISQTNPASAPAIASLVRPVVGDINPLFGPRA